MEIYVDPSSLSSYVTFCMCGIQQKHQNYKITPISKFLLIEFKANQNKNTKEI